MNRRKFLGAVPAAVLFARQASAAMAEIGKKGVVLMNRIGPSSSELHIANADGTGERKFLDNSIFDYHACYSDDGKWVLFTSERNGLGQSDVFRARPDGTGHRASHHQPLGRRRGGDVAGRIAHRLRFHTRRLQGQYLGP
jgi:hypothetical protein